MASYAAVSVWGPTKQCSGTTMGMLDADGAAVRLTRRGRLLRSLVVLAVVVVFALVGVERLTARTALAATEPTGPVVTATVVVEQGDSLWGIAQRVAPGTDPRDVVERIRELNGLRSNLIQPGQSLLVPAAQG